MPKKTPARHQPQRPQPKKKDVLLVRAASATEVVERVDEGAEKPVETAKPRAPEVKGKAAAPSKALDTKVLERRPQTGAKPASQQNRNLPATQRAGRAQRQASRLTVGRQSNLVTPEHYRYVLKDLRLIAALAVIMFGIIIALTFVLPHFLKYS
jgi:adenine-specific DNA methylase